MSEVKTGNVETAENALQGDDFLPIMGTDYVEFYVGNAKQAAYYYAHAFGFQPLAYSGLETGNTEKTSYVLRQGKINLMLTTSLQADSEIALHQQRHGDGVKHIALWVDDAKKSFEECVKRGAEVYKEPEVVEDKFGKV